MKMVQIVLLFLSMFVMLGGLSLPIWWNAAQPLIFSIPGFLGGVFSDMTGLMDRVLESF
ncbi:MAG: hypothetical protein KJ729_08775 [Euryarchaeota archaeon]|nr:hypothetical protein [Euryarchaeota archaeon]